LNICNVPEVVRYVRMKNKVFEKNEKARIIIKNISTCDDEEN
jgi:hypothetical protein